MTREEAIERLSILNTFDAPNLKEAVRMAVAALRAQQDTTANAPLTLDELQEMDGEPVWIRSHRTGSYMCRVIESSGEYFTHFTDGGLCENRSYSSYWTAYRRKPEEGTV